MTVESAAPYEKIAARFDQAVPFFAAFGQLIVAAVDPQPGARVLDVGAGRGAISGPMAARGCRVTAIDAAPAMLAHVARDLPDVQTRVMDVHELALPDASFDVVTAGFVVDLLADPAQALRECLRVLRPGGQVALTLPSRRVAAGGWAFCNRLFAEYNAYRPRDGRRVATPLDGRGLLTGAGFVDVGDTVLTVRLTVPDADRAWQFLNTNGQGYYFDTLPADKREEFRGRLHAEFARRGGAVDLIQDTVLWTARRP